MIFRTEDDENPDEEFSRKPRRLTGSMSMLTIPSLSGYEGRTFDREPEDHPGMFKRVIIRLSRSTVDGPWALEPDLPSASDFMDIWGSDINLSLDADEKYLGLLFDSVCPPMLSDPDQHGPGIFPGLLPPLDVNDGPWPGSDEIDVSQIDAFFDSDSGFGTSKYKCRCGFEPSENEVDKSSKLERHQSSRQCPRFCPFRCFEGTMSFRCPYPGCDNKYFRYDNLRVHQKRKHRTLEIEMPHINLTFATVKCRCTT
jgi:hypothetical protein